MRPRLPKERRERTEIFLPNFMAGEKGKTKQDSRAKPPFMSSPGYFDIEAHKRASNHSPDDLI